jgi:hypothetical protein
MKMKRLLRALKFIALSPLIAASALAGVAVVRGISQAIEDMEEERAFDEARWNHTLAEGATYRYYKNSESEVVTDVLRDCRRMQREAPVDEERGEQVTFSEDFTRQIGEYYDDYPELFSQ